MTSHRSQRPPGGRHPPAQHDAAQDPDRPRGDEHDEQGMQVVLGDEHCEGRGSHADGHCKDGGQARHCRLEHHAPSAQQREDCE